MATGGMDKQKGFQKTKEIIQDWSKVYINQVFFVEQVGNCWSYEVEFSKPQDTKPIPHGTVKIYFQISEKLVEATDAPGDEGLQYEFNFENESLIHKLDATMRTNMFESWINNVLEKKMKIQEELHLGTEFEYTRHTDNDGNIQDPFVPKFDIQKIKNLDREKKKSQEINVDSPRFISTLKRALEEMFLKQDKDQTDYLNYDQFKESFKTLTYYNLSENDVKMMIATADEREEDEMINWKEFIPIALDLIQTTYRRNLAGNNKPVPYDCLSIVYNSEIKKLEELLLHDLKDKDTVHTGDAFAKKTNDNLNNEIRIADFKKIIRKTIFLTPKEKNLIIREIRTPTVNYANFQDIIYRARYEIAIAKVMDTSINEVCQIISNDFENQDEEGEGYVEIGQAGIIMRACKKLCLTPFQINVLLGFSDPDPDGTFFYRKWIPKCYEYIKETFMFEAMVQKQKILQMGLVEDVKHDAGKNFDAIELFRTFKKYDRNQNGTLDFGEYYLCMEMCDLELPKHEIVTMTLNADLNGDGEIDFQEFVKHFTDILDMMSFDTKLQNEFNKMSNNKGFEGDGHDHHHTQQN